MRRAHPEAYNAAQGNLPAWIEIEKAKKREAAQARYAGSKRQAMRAKRESMRRLTKAPSPGPSDAPPRDPSPSPFEVSTSEFVQVFATFYSPIYKLFNFLLITGFPLGYHGVCWV
jgi:hypothetical protein